MKDVAEHSLGDLDFIGAKVEAGRVYELIDDYVRVFEFFFRL